MCTNDVIEISPVRKQYSVFIQMDKPIYKANDIVQFRVILFNKKSQPYSPKNLRIKISDATNATMYDVIKRGTDVQHGILSSSFVIGEEPNLGLWQLSVEVNDLTSEAIKKVFKVDEYVLPLINVDIDANSYILSIDAILRMTISAKYSFGILAKGNATVIVNVYDSSNNLLLTFDKNLQIHTKKTLEFNLVNELKINPEDDDRKLEVIVRFTDAQTKKKVEKVKEIHRKSKDSFVIKAVKPENYIPGSHYNFYVSIRDHSGGLQTSKSFPVNMKCQYSKNENYDIVQPSFLEDGRAHFNWFIPNEATHLKVIVTYRDSSIDFESVPGCDVKTENFVISIVTKQLSITNNTC